MSIYVELSLLCVWFLFLGGDNPVIYDLLSTAAYGLELEVETVKLPMHSETTEVMVLTNSPHMLRSVSRTTVVL